MHGRNFKKCQYISVVPKCFLVLAIKLNLFSTCEYVNPYRGSWLIIQINAPLPENHCKGTTCDCRSAGITFLINLKGLLIPARFANTSTITGKMLHKIQSVKRNFLYALAQNQLQRIIWVYKMVTLEEDAVSVQWSQGSALGLTFEGSFTGN